MEAAPQPAYSTPSIDREFYRTIEATLYHGQRNLVYSYTIKPRFGHAWKVPAGGIFRLTTTEGPQVGDLNLWNLHNPRERFWAARTRQLQSSHVSVGDRLWSCLPYLRPMCTIIEDTLKDYGTDEYGGRCHDLLGTRCDPYVNRLLTGAQVDNHCHSNLTRAVMPYKLSEYDIHDVLNVFQVTGLDANGKYFMRKSPAVEGSYIEFFAEIDLLCALSTCPGGDLSAWEWDGDKNDAMANTCRPIEVMVWELKDPSLLHEWWNPPTSPDYSQQHGLSFKPL